MMNKLSITEKDREEAKNIRIRSDEMQDILGQVPQWIVRYGTIVIFAVLLILICGSAILKYPDIINARVILTTENPPADLTANVSAKIKHILIADKQMVDSNQVLAILESAAEYEDIYKLSDMLGEQFTVDILIESDFSNDLKLGSVQDAYAGLQKKIDEYKSYVNLDYYKRKMNSIQSELNQYNLFLSRLKEQGQVLEREYMLADKQYQRDSMLFVQQVLSSSQLEKSETARLNKLYKLKETQTELAAARIEVSDLEQEQLELELKLEESGRSHLQSIREGYEKLKGQISLWMNAYVLRSPFYGQVTFTKFWSDNQYVNSGETVMTVLPAEQGSIVGKTELSAFGVGKVKEGHSVIIKFDNYPYLEFGTIAGTVSSISLVPNNEYYSAEISIDSNVLVTNYNITLNFQQNMPGNAEIVTEERSLLLRILEPFKSAINRQKDYNK